MKFTDLIKLSWNNARRTKSSLIIMILISVASISCLFSVSYRTSFDQYWKKYVNKNPELRYFSVTYHDLLNERIKYRDKTLDPSEKLKMISKTENKVIKILSSNSHILGTEIHGGQRFIDISFNKEEKYNGSIGIIGAPDVNNIVLSKGKNLDSFDENDNVLICPNHIYLGKDNLNNYNYDENRKVDISKFVGEKVKVSFSEKEEEFELIGLYDTESSYSLGHLCYTNYNTSKKIKEISLEKDIDYLEYMNSVDYQGDPIEIMIDDIENLDNITKLLRKNQLFLTPMVDINTETVDMVMKNCSYITIGTLLVSGIVVCFTLIQNIMKRNKDFFIYNALGYSKRDIFKLIFMENSILVFIGYIFAIPITQIGLMFFKNAVLSGKSRLYLMNPTVGLLGIILGLLISLLIPILVTLITYIFAKNKIDSLVEE